MMEKIRRGFKKYKNKCIVGIILWLLLSIVFVSPISVSISKAATSKGFDFQLLVDTLGQVITNPFTSLGLAFSSEHIGMFWSILWKFSILYFLIMAIGIAKAVPKTEYGDIELAQKLFLPVDKRGNVNVLVVGRFRFW
jgi:hypothetical protein